MTRPHPHLIVLLLMLVCQTSCGPIPSVEDQWYRRIRGGELMPVPFSHELKVLGYQGWRYIGKLPPDAAEADAIAFRLWFETDDPPPDPAPPPAAEGRWPIARDGDPRRVDIDLILQREVKYGEARVSYRALINGRNVWGQLPIPPGYRQSITASPVREPVPLVMDQPIPLGTATLEAWTAHEAGRVRYVMRNQAYRWFVRLTAEQGPPLP